MNVRRPRFYQSRPEVSKPQTAIVSRTYRVLRRERSRSLPSMPSTSSPASSWERSNLRTWGARWCPTFLNFLTSSNASIYGPPEGTDTVPRRSARDHEAVIALIPPALGASPVPSPTPAEAVERPGVSLYHPPACGSDSTPPLSLQTGDPRSFHSLRFRAFHMKEGGVSEYRGTRPTDTTVTRSKLKTEALEGAIRSILHHEGGEG